ncbi:MAG: Bax inhibitor-1 family protein [Pirellulales bacterium]|nr:Bax inhibitor-1 family protein [Pirellulales bacterium]
MSYGDVEQSSNPYASFGMVAADAGVDARADFIRKTYLHLAGAVLAFVALSAVVQMVVPANMMLAMFSSPWSWLIVLGAFMAVSMIASSWASSAVSPGKQYAGLGLYVVAESIIFAPLLYMASHHGPDNLLLVAGGITLALFGVLTAIVWVTGADFSFMRSFLMFAGFAAMGYIVVSMFVPGLGIGLIFTVLMILLMCGYILYDTSNVMHHYHIGQHVAAALALFASLATLFWYVIQLVWELQGD